MVLVLLPSVVLQLLAILVSKQRPWLAVAAVSSGLISLAFTVSLGRYAPGDLPYTGWAPVVWAGLVALSQLTTAFSSVRAWLLAPSSGPGEYVWAFTATLAIFTVWSILVAPIGGRRASARQLSAT